MTTAEEKRLFVGGLVKGIKEDELVEKFSRFGQVSNVEIKTRATETDSKTFAYLNLTAEENDFKKCFTAYNNTKWKGGQLKLQFAKESFLSKLKKEQAEAQMPKKKVQTSVHKSPALESDRKAVPGTPMDDKGTWVMGKYSRVLPVLNIRKPGSRKIVTLDPSKTSHQVKKLKTDDYDAEQHLDLTWQLEENTSEINKRRQGQFPEMEAPRYHSTPKEPSSHGQESIASRLLGLVSEEQISDTEMEVVPVGKGKLQPVSRIHAHSGYNSDDSAGSADTDEIVFKASKIKSKLMQPNSVTTTERKVKKKKQSLVPGNAQFCDKSVDTPSSKSCDKKTPESLHSNERSAIKNHKLHVKDTDTEEIKKTEFQFVKNPELKGKALKKSTKLSQSSKSKTASVKESGQLEDAAMQHTTSDARKSNKTPEFKGLSMLSSDSEDNVPSARTTTGSGSNKGENRRKEATADKHTRKVSSIPGQKISQKHVSSDSEDTDDVLSHPQSRAVKKQEASIEETTKFKNSDMPLCKSAKKKCTEPLDSSMECSQTSSEDMLSNSHSQKRKKIATSEVTDIVSLPIPSKSNSSAVKRNGFSSHAFREDTSEYESGLVSDSSFPALKMKRKKAKPDYSDDSDLDDNDFEKVGKKLAARALGKQQQGAGSGTGASFSATSDGSPSKTRKRKSSQGEEGHLTSVQKSHQAYSKIQKEQKKKENLITRTLREGTTEAKHIKFTDSDEDKGSEMKPEKMSLFSDDSESDESVDFSLRRQFEGSKGKKLFELQSRILDNRFRFDERFNSSDSDGDVEISKEEESEDELGTEKKRNQEILEKILGCKPRQRTKQIYEAMNKRRYDPHAAINPCSEMKTQKKKRVRTKGITADNREQRQQSVVEEDSGGSSSDHMEQDLQSTSQEDSDLEHSAEEAEDSGAESEGNDSGELPRETAAAAQGESLKSLFSGGASFTFFGIPDAEDVDESEAFSNMASTTEEKKVDEMEEEDMEDEEEDKEEKEDKEDEEDMSILNKSWVQDSDRLRPPVQQQPSFMVARNDPRLAAAVRYFKRPHAEDFEEKCEKWGDERQRIMQLVRDRHKKACRKERQMKQGVKSRPFLKTKMGMSAKAKKR